MDTPYPFTVTIRWGQDYGDERPEHTYSFATKAELDAFMSGVEEASGWLEHEVLHDSRRQEA